MPDALMTTEELADELELSAGTLANWRSAGSGPPYVKLGRQVRYNRIDVDDWISGQLVKPATQL